MTKRDEQQTRQHDGWKVLAAVGSLFLGLGGLWTAVSAERTQTFQAEPFIGLESAITAESKSYHAEGQPPSLDTEVILKNTGSTQALNLKFTSMCWRSVPQPREVDQTHIGGAILVMDPTLTEATCPWQVHSGSDPLDRDQTTRHLFQNLPQSSEPQRSTNYIYMIAEYDDENWFPFGRHHITKLCIVKQPAGTDNGSGHNWNREPLSSCEFTFKSLSAKQGEPVSN